MRRMTSIHILNESRNYLFVASKMERKSSLDTFMCSFSIITQVRFAFAYSQASWVQKAMTKITNRNNLVRRTRGTFYYPRARACERNTTHSDSSLADSISNNTVTRDTQGSDKAAD